jgi:hypothetical protein
MRRSGYCPATAAAKNNPAIFKFRPCGYYTPASEKVPAGIMLGSDSSSAVFRDSSNKNAKRVRSPGISKLVPERDSAS